MAEIPRVDELKERLDEMAAVASPAELDQFMEGLISVLEKALEGRRPGDVPPPAPPPEVVEEMEAEEERFQAVIMYWRTLRDKTIDVIDAAMPPGTLMIDKVGARLELAEGTLSALAEDEYGPKIVLGTGDTFDSIEEFAQALRPGMQVFIDSGTPPIYFACALMYWAMDVMAQMRTRTPAPLGPVEEQPQ